MLSEKLGPQHAGLHVVAEGVSTANGQKRLMVAVVQPDGRVLAGDPLDPPKSRRKVQRKPKVAKPGDEPAPDDLAGWVKHFKIDHEIDQENE